MKAAITIHSDNKASLYAEQTLDVMIALRHLEGRRRWSKKEQAFNFEPTKHNLEILGRELDIYLTRDQRISAPEVKPSKTARRYRSKTKPYPHQVSAMKRMKDKTSFALFMEQGTGKSKVIIDKAGELFCKGLLDGVIVIAPKGVHRQWIDDQLPTHCGVNYNAAFWPRPFNADFTGDSLDFIAINYDAVKTLRGHKYIDYFLQSHQRVLLVLDESHMVKNARTQRWSACNSIRLRCQYAMLSTGTPIAKDLTDEWAQMKLLNPDIIGIKYITAFRNEYCLMGGFGQRQVIGAKNISRFKSKTAPFVFRARKSELGIAPKQYSTFTFDMTAKQRRHYKEMARLMITEIDTGEIADASTAAVKALRLQQISNGFITDENGEIKDLFDLKENPRLIALNELILGEGLKSQSLLVWCRFHRDVEMVSEYLAAELDLTNFRYYGKSSPANRAKAVKEWLGGEFPVLIATPGSGGTGLNLQGRCTNAIYFSNSENSIDRWQSEDRIHRIGTREAVTYHDLIATASRDRAILMNLKRKKKLSALTLDDFKKELLEAVNQ